MSGLLHLFADPTAWAALFTLIVMEVVLGIDNLVFISVLTNKLPPGTRTRTRSIGISMALVLRLALLSVIAFVVSLTHPVIDLGLVGPKGDNGKPLFETAFSWRDLILIAGGLFLIYKATSEVHQALTPGGSGHGVDGSDRNGKPPNFTAVVLQILVLDIVFSVDSILTAVGMTDHLPIMMIAVVVAVLLMLVASVPLSAFIRRNPTIVMLALGFLLMIGMTLIADGFGVHVHKGYIYVAMAFSGVVEGLNMLARRRGAGAASVGTQPDAQPGTAEP